MPELSEDDRKSVRDQLREFINNNPVVSVSVNYNSVKRVVVNEGEEEQFCSVFHVNPGTGDDVIAQIKQFSSCPQLPVVVKTMQESKSLPL